MSQGDVRLSEAMSRTISRRKFLASGGVGLGHGAAPPGTVLVFVGETPAHLIHIQRSREFGVVGRCAGDNQQSGPRKKMCSRRALPEC